MSNRKPHNDMAGYVCELRNKLTGRHNIILDLNRGGAWAGTPTEGGRWMTLCNDHSTIVQQTSLPLARLSMKDSTNFCDKCRELAALKGDG